MISDTPLTYVFKLPFIIFSITNGYAYGLKCEPRISSSLRSPIMDQSTEVSEPNTLCKKGYRNMISDTPLTYKASSVLRYF